MKLVFTTNCSCYMYIMKNSEFIEHVVSLSNPEFQIVSDTKIYTVSEHKQACRVGESWTSTFPTFHLLLFCVIAALCGALPDTEGRDKKRAMETEKEIR